MAVYTQGSCESECATSAARQHCTGEEMGVGMFMEGMNLLRWRVNMSFRCVASSTPRVHKTGLQPQNLAAVLSLRLRLQPPSTSDSSMSKRFSSVAQEDLKMKLRIPGLTRIPFSTASQPAASASALKCAVARAPQTLSRIVIYLAVFSALQSAEAREWAERLGIPQN